jgi:signal transduction histidine kinase
MISALCGKKKMLYHDLSYLWRKKMTLKKQIYFNNVRFAFITIITFILVPLAIRVAANLITGTEFTQPDRPPPGSFPHNPMLILFIFLIVFGVIIAAVNNFLTYRLIKKIARPLEALGEGVKQVQQSNLAYQIDYQIDDEFRPVCNAFNEMTSYLKTAALQQHKDEANRRELIAGISHDLRTPLTSIKGCLEGLETGVASTPEMREKYFNTIKNKTSDLEHIIEQLFLFSKLDMNEFPLTFRRAAIVPLIEDMIEESAAEYTSRGLDISFSEITDALRKTFVSLDTICLRNVIINIFENSILYKTNERAKVEISAALHDDTIVLRFADDGPGVTPDAFEKLFSAFYRNDPSRDKKGSGLGLAISAKVIERMGGSCRAEASALGGLAIIISLPILKEVA